MLLKVGLPQTKRYLQGKGKQGNERTTCGMGKKNCNRFDKGLSTKKMYNMRVQVNFY